MARSPVAICVVILLTAIWHEMPVCADNGIPRLPKLDAKRSVHHDSDAKTSATVDGNSSSASNRLPPSVGDESSQEASSRDSIVRGAIAFSPFVPIEPLPPSAEPISQEIGNAASYNRLAAQESLEIRYQEEIRQQDPPNPPRSVERELELLKQRIEELNTARIAHEDATRTIIRQSFADRGSNITDIVAFGGTLEAEAGWVQDFDGTTASDIALSTAELDFEIQANDWTLGSLIFEYLDGRSLGFLTAEEDVGFVDRVNIDTAFIRVGNTQRFWLFGTFGRIIVPFGISTGDPVVDVLNIDSPLTVEIFETREEVIMIGFEGPTPPQLPVFPQQATLPPPKARPLVLAPLVQKFARRFGYQPLPPLPLVPTVPIAPPPDPPPFSGAIYFYNGDTTNGGNDHIKHIGGTLGFRTKGCYHSVPWTLQTNVDFNSSVFDSRFLRFEYRSFLDEIGFVPGMAAHIKTSVGPVAIVAEWNGALYDATFDDDLSQPVRIAPGAWQASFAYQFDWNPSIKYIGEQGTYLTISYSESEEMAGVTRVINGNPERVGFAPEKRFLVGMGEWVLDGLRVAAEYSYNIDYSVANGGTGSTSHGWFTQMTYQW